MTQWAIEDGNISEANGTATNILSGLAKAWVKFDGTGTPAIDDSFNIASLTDVGTGEFQLDFTSGMSASTYCGVSDATTDTNTVAGTISNISQYNADNFTVIVSNSGASSRDRDTNTASIHGDLA